MALFHYASAVVLVVASFTLGVLFALAFSPPNYQEEKLTGLQGDSRGVDEKLVYKKTPQKNFVYVTQNENKVNPNYLESLNTEHSDLITLTYQKNLGRNDTIFRPKSTWASGRNELYFEVQRREIFQGWQYKYIIFLDGDLTIICGDKYGTTGSICWREFEKFLLDYEPAVGAPYYLPYGDDTDVKAVYYFEPQFTAVHVEAREALLPYYTGRDEVNWNTAPIYLNTRAAAYYINHVLMYTKVGAMNAIHTNYPKVWYGHYWDVDALIDNVVPEELMCNYKKPKSDKNAPPYDSGDPIFIHGVVKKKNRSYKVHCHF